MVISVVIVGVCGNGKSYLINRYIDYNQATVLHENRKQYAGMQRTTTTITRYRCANYDLIDTPGLFDRLIAKGFDKSLSDIEDIFKSINSVDYIILCISMNKNLVLNEVDIESKRILDLFGFPQDRIFVYLTKSDLLNDIQRTNFMKVYNRSNIFAGCKTFIWEHVNDNRSIILSNDKYLLFNQMTELKIPFTDIIDDTLNIPIINCVQKYMEDNELYPLTYIQYYNEGSWLFKLLCRGGTFHKIPIIRYNKPTTITLLLIELKGIKQKNMPYYDTIRYDSGDTFYEGTFRGCQFHIGSFNDELTGKQFYHKNL